MLIYTIEFLAMISDLTLLEMKGREGGNTLILKNIGESSYPFYNGRSQCNLCRYHKLIYVCG